MNELKVNDRVVWYSQAGGKVVGKKGIVVAIVPIGVDPNEVMPKNYTWEKADPGGKRKEVSYLISMKIMKVQRPLTKYLRQMTEAEAADPNFMPPEITYDQWKAMIPSSKKAKAVKTTETVNSSSLVEETA